MNGSHTNIHFNPCISVGNNSSTTKIASCIQQEPLYQIKFV